MNKKILLVDDDPVVLEFVRQELTADGWSCTTAREAMEGFEKARDLRPALIISDFQMPDFGKGTDLVRAVRRDPALVKTPVIIITGMNLATVKTQLPKDDARVRLLNKPADMTAVRACMGELGVASPRSAA